jgi:hypothetical protein
VVGLMLERHRPAELFEAYHRNIRLSITTQQASRNIASVVLTFRTRLSEFSTVQITLLGVDFANPSHPARDLATERVDSMTPQCLSTVGLPQLGVI